jgi:hypothetical protein
MIPMLLAALSEPVPALISGLQPLLEEAMPPQVPEPATW